MKKILLFANTDWYLFNFRLPLARELIKRGYDVVMVSPPGEYAARIKQAGIYWVPLKMDRRRVNPFLELATLWRLIRIYRRHKPDVVHHFTVKCVIYGSIAAKLSNVDKVVNAIAGMGFIFTSNSLLARILRPLIVFIFHIILDGYNKRLILQNPDDMAFFKRMRLVGEDHIHLIKGSGVNTGRFVPNTKKQTDQINVLLASRLLWDKGVQDYVDAARIVRGRWDNVSFMLAGVPDAGNPGSVQQSDIEMWHDTGDIQALGHVEDMSDLLNKVHIVVLPTVYGEGVPRILIEAAAAAIPLVATDVPGCREIVNDGINGYLVPPRDPQVLAGAIERLVVDADSRDRMGRQGRRLVLVEFEETSVLDRTIAVYEELLS